MGRGIAEKKSVVNGGYFADCFAQPVSFSGGRFHYLPPSNSLFLFLDSSLFLFSSEAWALVYYASLIRRITLEDSPAPRRCENTLFIYLINQTLVCSFPRRYLLMLNDKIHRLLFEITCLNSGSPI